MRTFSAGWVVLGLVVLGTALLQAGCLGGQVAAQKADEKIRQSTDMGLDNMVKAKDMSVQSQIEQGIASDPGMVMVKDKLQVTVSHNVVTVTGKVKTEEQKARVKEIVENAVKSANVKSYELDIELDPSIPDPPFDW